MRNAQGLPSLPIDWKKVTKEQMEDLATKQMNAAGVPASVQKEYWAAFEKHVKELEEMKKKNKKK